MTKENSICTNEHRNFKNSMEHSVLHRYMRKRLKRPEVCAICKKKKKLDLVFKNHKAGRKTPNLYTRNPKDWYWLCRTCHMKEDGRVKSIKIKVCTCGKKILYNQYGTFHYGGGKARIQIEPKRR